jgi:WD40 repeat protein
VGRSSWHDDKASKYTNAIKPPLARAALSDAVRGTLSAHWESLGAADASKAYEARADLLHAPKSAVPFLAKRLQPAPTIDAGRVAGLINQLGSNTFRERDQAARDLEGLGELVREPLRKAMAAKPPEETRRRLESLLGKMSQHSRSQLRTLRGVEILEGIGTPEALRVVERLTRGNADGLMTIESRAVIARRQKRAAPLPQVPAAQEKPAVSQAAPPPGPVLPDLEGDPMPAGAIARLGSARWRLTAEPRRIIVSPDGKQLAVVTSFSGPELLDARTGRSVQRAQTGFFSWGFDLRMAVALSADWQTVAAPEAGDRSGSVLTVLDRRKAGKVTIAYGRNKEALPVVPEEVEGSGGVSTTTIEYLSGAAFSPDGKTLVGSVRFDWECSGGKIVKKIKENHVVAWDTSTGKELWKTLGPADEIHTVSFSPDGKTVSVVDRAGVGFRDAATGREVRRWRSRDPLFSARYSADRTWLATGSKGEVLLWEVATGKVRRRLAVPGKEIKAIAFSSDGSLLAGGADNTIRLWDPRTGKAHGDCSAFPSPVEAVAFSGDGKTLFSGHEQEHALRRWDVASRKPSGGFNSPIAPVRMLSFSRDSRTILASATGENFYLWEAATGKPCPLPQKADERFLADWLASSGEAALLRCEEGFGAQFAMLLTGKVDRLDQVPGFLGSSVDGRRLLVQTEKDKRPCLTVLKVSGDKGKDKDKGKDGVEREIVWKEGAEVTAALSPDGKTVVAAGKDVVCFIDVSTGRERRYAHPTNVKPELLFRTQSVKFSADGSRIALVGGGGKIRVLAVRDGRRIAELATKSRNLTGLAFSPDGQTLLTTSFNAPVHAWEIATGQLVRRLEAATYLYSPDNRLLAGSGGTLKVLDLYSGRVLRECKAEGPGFGNFAFSPNGKLLAASCSDTTIVVWPSSAAGARPGEPWDERSLAQALEKGGATEAYQAIGRMLADPQRALDLLERRLRPAPRLDAKHAQRLIADLDSDQSNRREAATKELARLGPLAEAALRATLASTKAPLKSKGRIEKLLRDLDESQTALSAEDVLHLRAVQALEGIGTRRARRLLENLARGAEMSPRTRAAVEALGRMRAR